MEGRRLILKDNTVIENGEAGDATGSLVLFITGYTMRQAADMFIEHPEKTDRITFQFSEEQQVFDGFTRCVNIGIDDSGEITAIMEKG